MYEEIKARKLSMHIYLSLRMRAMMHYNHKLLTSESVKLSCVYSAGLSMKSLLPMRPSRSSPWSRLDFEALMKYCYRKAQK